MVCWGRSLSGRRFHAFDAKDQAVSIFSGFQQLMAALLAKMREVDGGDGIGGDYLYDGPVGSPAQMLLRSQYGQWAGKTRRIKQIVVTFCHALTFSSIGPFRCLASVT